MAQLDRKTQVYQDSMRVYIAGKYTVGNTEENIAVARNAMWELIRLGHVPFCPHTMTAYGETVDFLSYEDFMRVDLAWLSVCDAILMLPGWGASPGAVREHAKAIELGMLVYYSIYDLPQT